MTDELFLIAHKVRGEPAFDIAIHMECPVCDGGATPMCTQCDEVGHWWIIPTSGHRAFPYWARPLDDAKFGLDPTELAYNDFHYVDFSDVGEPPADLRDHYTTEAVAAKSLIDLLGLIHAPLQRTGPMKRRF